MNVQPEKSLTLSVKDSSLSGKSKNSFLINQDINGSLPYKIYNSPTESFDTETIFYISDLHILHNIDINLNITHQICSIAKRLHDQVQREEKSNNYKILFAGDVSSDTSVTKQFFHYLSLYFQYDRYKRWKQGLHTVLTLEEAQNEVDERIKRLSEDKERYLRRYRKWRKYTKRQEEMDEEHLLCSIGKDKSLPPYLKYIAHSIKTLEKSIGYYVKYYNYAVEKLTEQNYFKKDMLPIFVVLGNHELGDFKTVDAAVEEYSSFFHKKNIFFLHNQYVNVGKCVVLGGIGFAKYNQQYNARNICTTMPPMTRAQEIQETDCFLKVYNTILKKCTEENVQLIVLTHYPTYCWLPNTRHNPRCIYFYGHDHRNFESHLDNAIIYAGNQIGYCAREISFKACHLGTILNPYVEYEDGCYKTDVNQYALFYRYNNEVISTKLIQKTLNTHSLYMIKQDGYYGFFLVQSSKIYICQGGRIKLLHNIPNLISCEKGFRLMVEAYLNRLWPYRSVQMKISQELVKLGFSGKVHGFIVDIDYFNHIMLDPLRNEVQCYYSPIPGIIKAYQSFDEFIHHYINSNQNNYLIDQPRNELLSAWEISKASHSLLSSIGNRQNLLAGNTFSERDYDNIGLGGVYSASRKMRSLQRLFEANILREWDDSIFEEIVRKVEIEEINIR